MATTCSIDGCQAKHYGRGWCSRHYQRWWKHGDPLWDPQRPPLARFWEKVGVSDVADPDACWLWRGSTWLGYGRFNLSGARPVKTTLAHRFLYELLIGPVPRELSLDHLCRVRNCVNPVHLEPVTHAENVRRGAASRRAEREAA